MNEFKLLGRVGNVEITYFERTGKSCTKVSNIFKSICAENSQFEI